MSSVETQEFWLSVGTAVVVIIFLIINTRKIRWYRDHLHDRMSKIEDKIKSEEDWGKEWTSEIEKQVETLCSRMNNADIQYMWLKKDLQYLIAMVEDIKKNLSNQSS